MHDRRPRGYGRPIKAKGLERVTWKKKSGGRREIKGTDAQRCGLLIQLKAKKKKKKKKKTTQKRKKMGRADLMWMKEVFFFFASAFFFFFSPSLFDGYRKGIHRRWAGSSSSSLRSTIQQPMCHNIPSASWPTEFVGEETVRYFSFFSVCCCCLACIFTNRIRTRCQWDTTQLVGRRNSYDTTLFSLFTLPP